MLGNKKIGVGITTYNSEAYFRDLYESLQGSVSIIDEIVVVNGGNEYEGQSDGSFCCDWIQHTSNRYPSVCRNDAVSFLMNRDVDYLFLIEDDMIVKSSITFKKYIEAHEASGLSYLCYASTSDGSRNAEGVRTPTITFNYPMDIKVSFYPNMCNEFTFHTREVFEKVGLYDVKMRDAFDVDMVYRRSIAPNSKTAPFWWFADIEDSDLYVANNPNTVSRLQAGGERQKVIAQQWEYFKQKHGLSINEVPRTEMNEVYSRLRDIYGRK